MWFYVSVLATFCVMLCTSNEFSTLQPIIKRYSWDRNRLHFNLPEPSTSKISPRMATPCLTPNGDTGYCVEIQNCPILIRYLNDTDAIDFLRKSRCGPRNENNRRPKVCCGRYGNYKHLVKKARPFPKKCGYQPIVLSSRIIGGEEAELGEFPWLARLIHRNPNGLKSYGCVGFLIQSRYILTAAHCIDFDSVDTVGPVFEVVLGEHDAYSRVDCNDDKSVCADSPQKIRVAESIVHPSYERKSKDHHYDIALIHLRKSVKFSQFVQPICLNEEPTDNLIIDEYWLSGWGRTETTSSSSVKLKVSIPPYNMDKCINRYKLIGIEITDAQICAGGVKNRDSCTGDSGGPLMFTKNGFQWFAAGVVSYGLGCGKQGWPAVYTNVTVYMEWIRRQIVLRAVPKMESRFGRGGRRRKLDRDARKRAENATQLPTSRYD